MQKFNYTIDNCLYVGTLIKPYGVKGQIVLQLDAHFEEDITTETIFIEIDKLLVPFFISSIKRNYNRESYIISFEDIDDIDKAKNILNKKLFIYLEDKDKPDSYNIDNYIDYKVDDLTHGYIGIVNDKIDIPKNPLLKVINNNKEFLIPFNQNIIIDIDNKLLIIKTKLPEGILDI